MNRFQALIPPCDTEFFGAIGRARTNHTHNGNQSGELPDVGHFA
jgi:hypothetical protein